MKKTTITEYYQVLRKPMEPLTPKKRIRTSTPNKVAKKEPLDGCVVITLSSDEDTDIKEEVPTRIDSEIKPLSQSTDSSNTIPYDLYQEYSLLPETSTPHHLELLQNTPSKSLQSTPIKSPIASTSKSKSPRTFFSPNRKKNVTTKSPNKSARKMLTFQHRSVSSEGKENNLYNEAARGLDDKTQFLLRIICEYLIDETLKKFLNEPSIKLLEDYTKMSKPGMILVCRLYWRKPGWYKSDKLKEICTDTKNQQEINMTDLFKELCDKKFLSAISKSNLDLSDYESILTADELKDICKELKIKTQSKKNAVCSLREYCRRSSIASYFGGNKESNKRRVLKMMSDKIGETFKLSNLARSTLDRLYILMYLGMDYDIIRRKQLEFMLINEKIKRETYPIDKNIQLDNANVVFENIEDFERYKFVHDIYEEYLNTTDVDLRCDLIRRVYDLFTNLNVELIIRYKSLHLWLQRFTPSYIYVKILDEGIKDLKKDKSIPNYLLAVKILRSLLGQTFREHKKALWYAELALIYHKYLNNPDMASQVLIEGFESNLSEESKDCMRPRAKHLAQMKKVTLDDNVRQTLLAFANKECILEGSLPSHHIHKHAMENISKGKAMYETKNEQGRMIQGVEEYALAQYITTGEYTNGAHWEGRIVTTLFFLIFYDLIYHYKPYNVHGIFLSYYQRFPLDMYCPHFYFNRRIEIDERLKEIEQSTTQGVLDLVLNEWDNRPEYELSGINRDIGRERLIEVVTCLGPQRLGALMSRVARNYHYTHSGFPDLTLWNIHSKKIKFVEVKSDLDRPSMKQIQWMKYLLENGIETEFCYVGARTTKQKSRKPIKSEQSKMNTSSSSLNTSNHSLEDFM